MQLKLGTYNKTKGTFTISVTKQPHSCTFIVGSHHVYVWWKPWRTPDEVPNWRIRLQTKLRTHLCWLIGHEWTIVDHYKKDYCTFCEVRRV